MKALYIGYNSTYINEQKDIILGVFRAITDLTFYGPGYNSLDDLNIGIYKWLENQNTFDIIILDPGFVSHDENLTAEYYIEYFKSSPNDFLYFDPKEIVKFGKDYQEFFIKTKAYKFTFTTWDPYDISEKTIKFLINSDTFILDIFGDKLSKCIYDLKKQTNFKNFFKSNFNDNWIKFEKQYKHKIITFPHAIFASYFSFIPLKKRRISFSIIGVLYPERKQIIKLLSLNLKFKLLIKRIIEFLSFKFKVKSSIKKLEKRKRNYQNLIEYSKFCFVSGSPLRYPVRKYFEVPAKGSIPIGWKCNGFENLGFKDGENFIVAEDQKILSYQLKRKDSDNLQKIALNAQKLVFEKHSDYARITQLRSSLELIIKGEFFGSYWEDGEYKHYLD